MGGRTKRCQHWDRIGKRLLWNGLQGHSQKGEVIWWLTYFYTYYVLHRGVLSFNVLWNRCTMMLDSKIGSTSFGKPPPWWDAGRERLFVLSLLFFLCFLFCFSSLEQNMWLSWSEWWQSLSLSSFWWSSWKMVIFKISWGNAGKERSVTWFSWRKLLCSRH